MTNLTNNSPHTTSTTTTTTSSSSVTSTLSARVSVVVAVAVSTPGCGASTISTAGQHCVPSHTVARLLLLLLLLLLPLLLLLLLLLLLCVRVRHLLRALLCSSGEAEAAGWAGRLALKPSSDARLQQAVGRGWGREDEVR